jgi:hypothetical protein
LRPLSVDSDGGITRAQFPAAVGAHFPRGIHPGSVQIVRGSIFSWSATESVHEVRAHCLRQFPGRSEEFSHQGELSRLAAVVV